MPLPLRDVGHFFKLVNPGLQKIFESADYEEKKYRIKMVLCHKVMLQIEEDTA